MHGETTTHEAIDPGDSVNCPGAVAKESYLRCTTSLNAGLRCASAGQIASRR